jgi:hypothetical protein
MRIEKENEKRFIGFVREREMGETKQWLRANGFGFLFLF